MFLLLNFNNIIQQVAGFFKVPVPLLRKAIPTRYKIVLKSSSWFVIHLRFSKVCKAMLGIFI